MRISIIITLVITFLITAIYNISSLANTTLINSIQETSDLKNILDYVDKNTVIFLDLDNTIMSANQTLGTDQWYIDKISFFEQQGYNNVTAIDNAINQWRKIQAVTAVKPMQSNTAELINTIQGKSNYVFGLTARSVPVKYFTEKQLNSLNIDFNLNNKINNFSLDKKNNHALFHNGIVFVGPLDNKGKVMLRFLKKSGLNTKTHRIIFVDDKLHHVANVAKYAKKINKQFYGFRYNLADHYVKNYSRKIGDLELTVFEKCNKLISDQLAVKIKSFTSCSAIE